MVGGGVVVGLLVAGCCGCCWRLVAGGGVAAGLLVSYDGIELMFCFCPDGAFALNMARG